MQMRTVLVASMSELFFNYPACLMKFNNECGCYSWGDTDLTLVSRESMTETIKEIAEESETDFTVILERLAFLDQHCYIDLES